MNDSGSEQAGPSLLRRTVQTHWRTILMVALATTLLGAAYVVRAAPTYTSTAQVLINPLQGNAYSPDSMSSPEQANVGLTTEANLVSSPKVKDLASGFRAGDTVSAGVVVNSQLISIRCSSSSRASARDCAESVADAFLGFREMAANNVRAGDIATIDRQIRVTQGELDGVNKQLASKSPPPGTADQAQLLTLRLSDLQQSLADARAEATHAGAVVVPATLPKGAQLARSVVLVVLALVLGLALGAVWASWRTSLNDRIDSRFVTAVAGLPVLGTVQSLDAHHASDPATVQRIAEEYRQLRAAVLTQALPGRVISLNPVDAEQDISEFCVNLADFMVAAGYTVTLVELDATGRLSSRLGFAGCRGVSDVLADGTEVAEVLQTANGLRVLPIGSDPAAVADLTVGRDFRSTLHAVGDEMNFVFLVAPPVDSAVGLVCAAEADSILLVAADRRSTHMKADQQRARLMAHGLHCDGLIISVPGRKTRPDADSEDETEEPEAPSGARTPEVDSEATPAAEPRPRLRLADGDRPDGASA